jgi:hypothetical protein
MWSGRLSAGVVPGLASLAAVLLLSSCGPGVSPGVAAQIEDEEITTAEVDDLATVICEIDKGAGQGGKPMSAQRSLALTVLLGIEIGRQVGDVDAVPQQQVTQSLQAAADAREFVPEDLRDYFDEIVRESTRSAVAVDEAATARLEEAGRRPEPTAVQEEVARLQEEYLTEHPLEVDPRFGVYQDGQVVSSDGSVSVPVSERAKSFVPQATDDTGAAVQADLPASQVCG